ncbi:MAG: hypothetical protein ACRDSZ_01270, partial [Pseudonocardiaceae bacterium]
MALGVALGGNALDDPAGVAAWPWPELAAPLYRMSSELRVAADCAVLELVLLDLITELSQMCVSGLCAQVAVVGVEFADGGGAGVG